MNYQTSINCSGTMTDILIEGVKETIGINEFRSTNDLEIVNKNLEDIHPNTKDELFSLFESAPSLFGDRGARGIAHRIGESCFRSFLRKQGKKYLLSDNSYRLMNSQLRIMFGLKKLAEFADENCDVKIDVFEDEKHWFWQVVKGQKHIDLNRMYISYTFGLLREFFSWTSGGRYFPMEEVSDPDNSKSLFNIAIHKQPLGN